MNCVYMCSNRNTHDKNSQTLNVPCVRQFNEFMSVMTIMVPPIYSSHSTNNCHIATQMAGDASWE